MIEQKDIDRLLAGRKIIEDCRAAASEYRAAITAKISQVSVAEKYANREVAVKKMNEGLFALGFGVNAESAYSDFEKFNKAMILEEYKDTVNITFLGCEGCPTRKCIELYRNNACGNQQVSGVEDRMYLFFLRLIKMSKDGKEKNFADVKVCPDGYGFQWKCNRDERFDLWWK